MRFFISQLRGSPVTGQGGNRLGTIHDIVVGIEEPGYPPVRGLVVRAGKQEIFIPLRDVVTLAPTGVRLGRDNLSASAFQRRDGEVLLDHDICNQQLIDVQRTRVIRANDAAVRDVDGALRLVAIDVGARSMLRRLAPRRLSGLTGELVDWADLEPLASTVRNVHLRIRHDKVAKLHPSDIARIVDALAYPQGAEIMQALDDATAADTMEEMEPERQVPILEALSEDRAAGILGEMAPDAAADVLDDLPQKEADEIIDRMRRSDTSAAVRLLLSYPEHSAGGLMTTDVVIALEDETTQQAVEYIRAQIDKPDRVYYVYVVDDPDNQYLVGVVSLRDLLLAERDQPLRDYMRRDLRTIHPDESSTEVARLMTEYNLLALPVVDVEGRMLGLVTADDALEILLPERLKRHVPRLFH